MAASCFKVGSYGWTISTKTTAPFRIDGVPIDLTGWTVEAHLHPPRQGTTKVITTGVTGDAVGGVRYVTNNGDFDESGLWRVVFWVSEGAERFNSCDYSIDIGEP